MAIASIGQPKRGLVLDRTQLGRLKGEKQVLHTQAVEAYMKRLYGGKDLS